MRPATDYSSGRERVREHPRIATPPRDPLYSVQMAEIWSRRRHYEVARYCTHDYIRTLIPIENA